MGARHYDSSSGRFISPDPLGHTATPDLYSYALGDPINFFDPTGRMGVKFHNAIDSAIEIGAGIWHDAQQIDQYGSYATSAVSGMATGFVDTIEFGMKYSPAAILDSVISNITDSPYPTLQEEFSSAAGQINTGINDGVEYMTGIDPSINPKMQIAGEFTGGAAKLGKDALQFGITKLDDLVISGSSKFSKKKAIDLSSELSRTGEDARRTLRSSLGLGRGNADEAHHLIPLGLVNHDLVQRAARGGFNFNGVDNGIALSFDRHRGVNIFHHNKYNKAVETLLDSRLKSSSNMSDAQAAQFLKEYTNQLRNGIGNSTGRLR
tara:strand:- start:614 stop:1576 length:963 start_codon:yes stop_codon:yes gene_type:complete